MYKAPGGPSLLRSNLAYNSWHAPHWATKGPPPIYTETCSNCGAVIPVPDAINIDSKHNPFALRF